MKKSLIKLIAICLIAFSCSSNQEKPGVAKDSAIAKQKPDLDLIPEANSYDPVESLPAEIQAKVKKLDSLYSKTIFYAKIENRYIFYVVKGDWKDPASKKFNDGKFKIGLIDEDLSTLLPCEYDKIYNPNATSQDYIEIEKAGKKGLFNFKTKSIVEPTYDIIFPSTEFIAIGKTGNEYFEIKQATGNPTAMLSEQTPTYDKLSKKWELDNDNKKIILLRDIYQQHYAEKEDEPVTSNGFVFTPSFLFNLGVLKEYTDNLDVGNNSDFVQETNKIAIDDPKSIGEELMAYVTTFFEEGVGGRPYSMEEYSYVITDKKNNLIDKKIISTNYNDYFVQNFCEDKKSFNYQYVNENLFEIKITSDYRTNYTAYITSPCYYYFGITSSGKIDSLTTNRVFSFTKFTETNENHFKGCYSKPLTDEEIAKVGEEGNMYVSQHLTIEDLDFMINEIYAEYGYKFKNEKWKKYFSSQKWYKPEKDQVEELFSELDKRNIKFIKDYRDKMRGKEQDFTKRKLIGYVAAG